LKTVLAEGGSAQTVKTLYQVNQAVTTQRSRVEAATNLTGLQRQIELKKIELTQLEAQAQATGQLPIEPPPPEPVQIQQPVTVLSIYSVLANDDLKRISERYRIPMSAIQAANPGLDLENLLPGDKIRLPEPPVRQSTAPFSR
jgi:LysM repeat protein